MSTPLRVSRILAWIIGSVTPALELARRWHEVTTMTVYWPSLLDDFLLGGFLLYGAWRVGRDARSGRAILAAAWGFMAGMAYGSFFSQLATISKADPSGLSPVFVVSVKGLGLLIGLVGLVCALTAYDDR